jgi:ABC-type Zn uptake system ZnuABC Zn-binding protein ZnuA
MMNHSNFKYLLPIALATACSTMGEPLKVCATVPDLGDLVRQVGGEEVSVTVFAKGAEDAHFVEPRPSFVKELSRADLYIQMGLELESGWAPVLLRGARNAKVQPGTGGYLDASQAIQAIDIPAGIVDRSQGDVHATGNPHYLLDPVNGLKVARLIRDRLIALRPARRDAFEHHYADFRQRLGESLVGPQLATLYDVEKLMLLHDGNRLDAFLDQQNRSDQLGGWLGQLKQHRGTPLVADHNMWNYFTRRFGLDVVGYMEPRPGLPPTTGHLGELVKTMRARDVKLIISSPYFGDRHASFLAQNSHARSLVLAHQVGAVPGTDDYLSMLQQNVSAIVQALEDVPR